MYEGLSADSKETQYAHKLREYIKEGLIDTNHAYGDFNVENNFTRSHALRVYEMLEKYNLQIPIFTNHGNGSMDSMQHNVGFLSHHFGNDLLHYFIIRIYLDKEEGSLFGLMIGYMKNFLTCL